MANDRWQIAKEGLTIGDKHIVGMVKVDMEKLRARVDSAYKLVILASKRARELNEGSPKLVETDSKRLTNIALEEIAAGKICYKQKGGKK